MTEGRRSSGLGWFYLGALLGAVLAAGAVVVATELQNKHHLRRLRRGKNGRLAPEEIAGEIDLVEGLTHVVSEGLNVMADAVARLSDSFGSARREAIRYGLGHEGSTGHGGSSHGWYTGEDDDDNPALYATAADLIHDDEFGDVEPMPS